LASAGDRRLQAGGWLFSFGGKMVRSIEEIQEDIASCEHRLGLLNDELADLHVQYMLIVAESDETAAELEQTEAELH
jgi:hypothetical protein